ncbi:MAG: hypothetical protein PHP98_01785, partial [Kiritimatiellae bacterium]|nr:hypothetical protein [Kiritimatiellia bacterium]
YYAADFYEIQGGYETYDYFLHGSADAEDSLTIWNGRGNALRQVPAPIISPAKLGEWRAPKDHRDPILRNPCYAYGFFRDTCVVPPDNATDFVKAGFLSDNGNGFSVFIPASGSNTFSLYTGKNPSIRQAQENSELADKYFRKFICIRMENPRQPPVFATVINPYAKNEIVKGVERILPNLLKINAGGDVDFVFENLRKTKTVKIGGKTLSLTGDYGYISLDAQQDFSVKKYHVVNGKLELDNKVIAANGSGCKTSIVRTAGENELTFKETVFPLPERNELSSFVKVINKNSKISFGYFIKAIDRDKKTLTTRGPLGFKAEEGTDIMEFKSFPKYKLDGENKLVFFKVNFN